MNNMARGPALHCRFSHSFWYLCLRIWSGPVRSLCIRPASRALATPVLEDTPELFFSFSRRSGSHPGRQQGECVPTAVTGQHSARPGHQRGARKCGMHFTPSFQDTLLQSDLFNFTTSWLAFPFLLS